MPRSINGESSTCIESRTRRRDRCTAAAVGVRTGTVVLSRVRRLSVGCRWNDVFVGRLVEVGTRTHFYRPLVEIYFGAASGIAQCNAAVFHWLSLLIHALNAALVNSRNYVVTDGLYRLGWYMFRT